MGLMDAPLLVLSSVLGSKMCLFFGRECLGTFIWMFFAVWIRVVCVLARIDGVIPIGVCFALPLFISILQVLYVVFVTS